MPIMYEGREVTVATSIAVKLQIKKRLMRPVTEDTLWPVITIIQDVLDECEKDKAARAPAYDPPEGYKEGNPND